MAFKNSLGVFDSFVPLCTEMLLLATLAINGGKNVWGFCFSSFATKGTALMQTICKGYRHSLSNYGGLNSQSYLKHFGELIIQKQKFKISGIKL